MMKKKVKGILAAALSVCTVLSAAPAVSAVNAAEEAAVIDDTSFRYSEGGANDGGWDNCGGSDAAATEHWANTPGAWAEIDFTGTDLEIYGKKAPNHRKFSVQIGEETVKCDAYAASATGNNEVLFSTEESGIELAAGAHTAKVTVLDEKNEAAANVLGMNLAYAKVYGGDETEEPEFPGYTNIDDTVATTTGEAFKIQYEPAGNWHQESGYSQFFDGTDTYSDKTEDVYYTMKFTGTGIEIHGSKNEAHANYDIYIDDVKAGTGEGNLAGGAPQHQQKLFEKKDLENKEHTLKVVKASGFADKAMQLDRITVYHDELAPDSISLSKTEVTLVPEGTTKIEVSAVPWAASGEVLWETSDAEIVTVEDGEITAKNVTERKTAIVTAKSAKDEKVTASVNVTVDPALSVMNAYVGNEKLLDMGEDYETLKSGSGNTFNGTAWRNDELNSKIIVTTEKAVKNVEVTASDFKTEDGKTLSKDNVDIKWLREVKANIGRGNQSAPVKDFPDIIYKGGRKDIDAKDVQFAWVNIKIPEDTAAGTYTGTLAVKADGLKQPFELKYTIEVLDLVQPSVEDVDYEVQIWQHPFAVADYYLGLGKDVPVGGGICNETNDDFYFTDAHLNLMRESLKEYASMGGHDLVANICEEAWGHQSFYGDPSMVRWTKMNDGSWKFDYTWYDKWVNLAIETGVIDPAQGIGQIKCYSMVVWNNFKYYTEDGEAVTENFTQGSPEWTEMWTAFLKDFVAHSQQMGWMDLTYISMDERSLEQLEPVVDLIEAVEKDLDADIKISSAMNKESLSHMEFLNRIDDISINLDNTNPIERMKEVSQERRDAGMTTTFYTCTGNYPTNYMISDPGDNYWTAWYSLTLGTDGFMRWAWDNYVYDMFGNTTYRYWEPGDGWYIYPEERENIDISTGLSKETGEPAAIYKTPRYEMFKQGLRDAAKAKYLLNQESVTDEQKTALKSVVENLAVPQKGGNGYGSATYPNQEQRMLVHNESARALTAVNALAREIAGSATPSVDKSALEAKLNEAKALEEKDYTEQTWTVLKNAMKDAQAVLDDNSAEQGEVDRALTVLQAAIDGLKKADTDNPGKDEPDTEKPDTGGKTEDGDKTGTGNGTPKTGDGAEAVPAVLLAALALSASVIALRKRSSYR